MLIALNLLCLFLLCWPFPAAAQLQTPLSFSSADVNSSDNSLIKKNVDEVALLLTAVDKHDRLVRGLHQDTFRVSDDDHPIEHFSYFQSETDLPLRIVILVDASGSLTSQLPFEAQVVKTFLRRVLRQQDLATVIAFNRKVWPLNLSITPAMLHKINESDADGTAIYDAVRAASIDLGRPSPVFARKLIVLLTDGEDNASHAGLQAAVNEALRNEVTIYALNTAYVDRSNLGHSYPSSPKEPPNLGRLASETGGEAWKAADMSVVDVFKKVETAIRNQYVLAFKPDPEALDSRFHRLSVTSTEHNVKIRTRSGYFALRTGAQP